MRIHAEKLNVSYVNLIGVSIFGCNCVFDVLIYNLVRHHPCVFSASKMKYISYILMTWFDCEKLLTKTDSEPASFDSSAAP